MANTASVLKDLIETLEDGKKGFADAAEKLQDSDRPDVATTFRDLSAQRATFSQELRTAASSHGEQIEEDGSMAASMHRGWMSLKDAITGDNPDGVVKAAASGEDHAVKEYKKALDEDLPSDVEIIVRRQFDQIEQSCSRVQAMADNL